MSDLLLIPLTWQDVDIDTHAKSQHVATLSVGNGIRDYTTEILSVLNQTRLNTYVSAYHVYSMRTDLNIYFKRRVTSSRSPPFTERTLTAQKELYPPEPTSPCVIIKDANPVCAIKLR